MKHASIIIRKKQSTGALVVFLHFFIALGLTKFLLAAKHIIMLYSMYGNPSYTALVSPGAIPGLDKKLQKSHPTGDDSTNNYHPTKRVKQLERW